MYVGNQFYFKSTCMSVYVHIQVNSMIACHFTCAYKTLWVQESLALSSAQSSSRAQYYDCFCC